MADIDRQSTRKHDYLLFLMIAVVMLMFSLSISVIIWRLDMPYNTKLELLILTGGAVISSIILGIVSAIKLFIIYPPHKLWRDIKAQCIKMLRENSNRSQSIR